MSKKQENKKQENKKKVSKKTDKEERQENKVVKSTLEDDMKEDDKSKEKSTVGKVQIWVKQEKIDYEAELIKLQVELLKLQNHVKNKGLKILMIFEGRDAAGKGGTIKRITEHLNPRGARVVH